MSGLFENLCNPRVACLGERHGLVHATRPTKELLLRRSTDKIGRCREDRGGRRDPGEAPRAGPVPDAAVGRHDQIPQIRAETVRPAEELSAMNDAKPDRVLDGDDQEVAEVPAVTEPLLGEGNQVDVTLDRRRHLQALLEVEAKVEIALREDRAVTADAGGALDNSRHAEAEAVDILDLQARRLDAGANAVLHEIQDDRGRLTIDPYRDRHR